MYLHISDSMTIEEVQDRFNECFPYLKLEFYSEPHAVNEGSHKKYLLHKKLFIGEIRRYHYNGVLEIKSWHTTAQVELELKEVFDLNVQIFRRDANDIWIQTTFSDSLTLKQQAELLKC